jgi:hypothetical protein
LTHSAVPLREMFTESRLLPSPDSLNDTVIELVPTFVTLAKLKCGLTARADAVNVMSATSGAIRIKRMRRSILVSS